MDSPYTPIVQTPEEAAYHEAGHFVARIALFPHSDCARVAIDDGCFKERFLDSKDPCGKAIEATDPTFAALQAKYHPDAPETGG